MLFFSPKVLTGVVLLLIGVILLQNVMNQKNDTYNNGTDGLMGKFQQSDYKLQFERVEIINFNKKFFKKFEIITFKRSRTSAAINVSFTLKVDIYNEGNAVFQAYRFASNEYRLFPLRFQLNFCDAIKKNLLGLQSLSQCGNFTGCPLKKDVEVFMCNWSPDQSRFPPLVPSGKYMLELQGLFRNTEVGLLRCYGEVFRPFGEK